MTGWLVSMPAAGKEGRVWELVAQGPQMLCHILFKGIHPCFGPEPFETPRYFALTRISVRSSSGMSVSLAPWNLGITSCQDVRHG